VPPLPSGVIDIMPIIGDGVPDISCPDFDGGDSIGDVENVSDMNSGDAVALSDGRRRWLGGAGSAKVQSTAGLVRLVACM
jgi:gluconate kinase